METYTKLFNSIITSTIWQEANETKLLWVTLLALSDANGEIHGSIPGLAKLAGITINEAEKGFNVLLSPDKYSRSQTCEGRRLEEIDGGWRLVNHEKYRDKGAIDERRKRDRERKRRQREREKSSCDNNVTSVTSRDTCGKSRQTETKTEISLLVSLENLDFEFLNRKGENFCRRSGLRLDVVTPELLAEIILMDTIEENFSIDLGNRVNRGTLDGKITKPKKYLKAAIRHQCEQHGVALADYEKAVSDAVEAARQP